MESCGSFDLVPYAFLFAGAGFLSAFIWIILMARADEWIDKILTDGFFSRENGSVSELVRNPPRKRARPKGHAGSSPAASA